MSTCTSQGPPAITTLWAAAYLADLPVRIRFTARPIEERTEPDGSIWRESFVLTVRPAERFTIHLWVGASSSDLARAHSIIAHAQTVGLDYGDRDKARLWHQRERGDWIYRAWHLVDTEDPGDLRECNDPACIKQFHSWQDSEQDDLCELEAIRGDWHLVCGFRPHGGHWEASASVFSDPPEGAAGLRAIRDLSNDYAWMLEECSRLNDTPTAETD